MDTVNTGRRQVLLASVLGTAATTALGTTSASGQSFHGRGFGPLRRIKAGDLEAANAEAGPASGMPVLLLHGWPYDIHTYVDVAPRLAAAGHRVIVPYLRGYGATRFLSESMPRNGQQAALAADAIALMDALGLERPIVAGCDWGARTACILAALWPERCCGLVSVSGYLIGSQELNRAPLPPQAELQWWYQYYFVTERGEAGYRKYTHEFARLIWQLASPKWEFSEATFRRSVDALDNPDHGRSPFTITAGDSASRRVKCGSTISNGNSHRCRSSSHRPSRWRVMPTGHRIPTLPVTPAGLRASTSIDLSRAGLATICRRKPPTYSRVP